MDRQTIKDRQQTKQHNKSWDPGTKFQMSKEKPCYQNVISQWDRQNLEYLTELYSYVTKIR